MTNVGAAQIVLVTASAVIALVLIGVTAVRSRGSPPDPRDLTAYLTYLERSESSEARAIRQRIEDAPAALQRERELCREAGVPLTPEQLEGPPPQPGQNAHEVYRQLTVLLKKKPLGPEGEAGLYRLSHESSANEVKAAKEHLLGRRDLMRLVDEAVKRPRYEFRLDWSRIAESQLPDYTAMRFVARVIKAESTVMAHAGQSRPAVDRAARGFVVLAHPSEDPLLIGWLVARAVHSINLAGMKQILYIAASDPEVAFHVAEAVVRNRQPSGLNRAFRGEAVFAAVLVDQARRGSPAELQEFLTWRGDAEPEEGQAAKVPRELSPAQRKLLLGMVDAVEAGVLRRRRMAIEALELPREERDRQLASLDAPRPNERDLISKLINDGGTNLQLCLRQEQRNVAEEETIIAAALILAHRARRGRLPERLTDVSVPRRAPGLPQLETPLEYRREGKNGFVVFSPVDYLKAGKRFDGGRPGVTPAAGQVLFRWPAPPPAARKAGANPALLPNWRPA